ncbi:hypothetical protein BDQ17DRAFT_1430754 [Cyathus striatus]|nr:hypothetical protein BDQ17DRAFT_1430754 [Cyathus striatus]
MSSHTNPRNPPNKTPDEGPDPSPITSLTNPTTPEVAASTEGASSSTMPVSANDPVDQSQDQDFLEERDDDDDDSGVKVEVVE